MTTDAVEEVDSIVDAGPIRLLERYKRQRAEDVVTAIYEDAERIERREVEEAISKLEARGDLNDVQCDVVEGMADTIVDRLLAAPTESIWQAVDRSTLHTAVQLFDPELETDDENTRAGDQDLTEVNDDD